MIKKTLYFSKPVKLKIKLNQLRIIQDDEAERSIPIEDIGYVIIDHYGISISHGVLQQFLDSNVCLITTNDSHLPVGMFLPLSGNSEQCERFRQQVGVGLPLKKQLWQQTVKVKIKNQAALLKSKKLPDQYLKNLIPKVLSDDKSNRESVASRYYWKILYEPLPFRRNREGKPPNNLLNYGYAILRAVIARSLVASGMLPMLGIHHHNRYDPFPLADDIMEPYRPFVDEIVRDMVDEEFDLTRLTPELKKPLLEIPVTAVKLEGEKLPLMLAASRTSASLARCFSGKSTKIIYPEICV